MKNKVKELNTNICILLFAKSPAGGRVKTRIAGEMGQDFALGLYKCFVEDSLALVEQVSASVGAQVRFCFHPPGAEPDFLKWLGEQDYFRPQTGSDLGERMKNAFENAFAEGFSKVVLIGSDIPDLPANFLREALGKLESHDAVVGPSSDGGYYLIGFSRTSFLPEAFAGIAWSTSAACAQTLAQLEGHGRSIHLLPEWHDVDTVADLDSLLLRIGNTSSEESKTCRYLRANGLGSVPNV